MAGGWETIFLRQLWNDYSAVANQCSVLASVSSSAPPPKIVFNKLNGRRYHTAPAPKTDGLLDGFTPAHEENVKFVSEGNICFFLVPS